MIRKNVQSVDDAFIYIAECNVAIVEHLAILKSKSKYVFDRQKTICQFMIDWIIEFELVYSDGTRVSEVIDKHDCSVESFVDTITGTKE